MMDKKYFLKHHDEAYLLRQTLTATLVLLVSTALFATLALGLSQVVGSEDVVILATFLLVSPITLAALTWLHKRDYYCWKTDKYKNGHKQSHSRKEGAFEKKWNGSHTPRRASNNGGQRGKRKEAHLSG